MYVALSENGFHVESPTFSSLEFGKPIRFHLPRIIYVLVLGSGCSIFVQTYCDCFRRKGEKLLENTIEEREEEQKEEQKKILPLPIRKSSTDFSNVHVLGWYC